MNKLHVRTGDEVMIISGVDRKKIGKVVSVSVKERKVIVEGLNIRTKHLKPRQQGTSGEIVEVEGPIYADKVMPVCRKCSKPTRVGHGLKNGEKIRVCKKCGAEL